MELRNFTNIWEYNTTRWSQLFLTVSKTKVRVFKQQHAYDIWALVGEIGGTWGLFLGLSALSVLEYLENAFLQVVECLSKRRTTH
jgi:hypothetical protein